MIGDGPRPEYAKYYSEVFGVENLRFRELTFCHFPTHTAVQDGEDHATGTVSVWSR